MAEEAEAEEAAEEEEVGEEDGGGDGNQEDVGRDAEGGEVRNPKEKERRLDSELLETPGARDDSAD